MDFPRVPRICVVRSEYNRSGIYTETRKLFGNADGHKIYDVVEIGYNN
jgi:hypothetical protein